MDHSEKNNFRNKYPNTQCRACNDSIETQEHVLEECPAIHTEENSKVTKEEIAQEDSESLKDVCRKIEAAMAKLLPLTTTQQRTAPGRGHTQIP